MNKYFIKTSQETYHWVHRYVVMSFSRCSFICQLSTLWFSSSDYRYTCWCILGWGGSAQL